MRGETDGFKLLLVPPLSVYRLTGPLRAEPGRSVYISLAGPGAMNLRDRGDLLQVLGFLLVLEVQVHQGDQDQPVGNREVDSV